jgi:hypothetical protein
LDETQPRIKSLGFSNIGRISAVTTERIRLLLAVRKKPAAVSELAIFLNRDRSAVKLMSSHYVIRVM